MDLKEFIKKYETMCEYYEDLFGKEVEECRRKLPPEKRIYWEEHSHVYEKCPLGHDCHECECMSLHSESIDKTIEIVEAWTAWHEANPDADEDTYTGPNKSFYARYKKGK